VRIPRTVGAISTEGQERGCLSRSMSNDESAWGEPNVSVRPKALRLDSDPSRAGSRAPIAASDPHFTSHRRTTRPLRP